MGVGKKLFSGCQNADSPESGCLSRGYVWEGSGGKGGHDESITNISDMNLDIILVG